MDEQSITPDDCKEILKNYSKNTKFVDFSIRSLAGDVEGYLSSHFELTIQYLDEEKEEKTTVFFMKQQIQSAEFLSEFAKSLDVFNKEIFIYKLCYELEKMDKFKKFAPKCYLFKDNILVMENLSQKGYFVNERNAFFELEECKVALATLALYHASFIAYEEKKSIELSRKYRLNVEFPEEYQERYYSFDKESLMFKYLAASEKLLIDLINIIPDDSINKEEFTELIMKEISDDPKKIDYIKNYRQCTLHCDLWSKNIMFKKDTTKITDCRLVDFQLLRYFLPGFDITLLINANTSSNFRKTHREELFKHYYKYLNTQLENYGINCSKLIPYQDLLDGALITEPSAKIMAFNDSALMHLPMTLLDEAYEKPELFNEILIEKRSDYVLEVYKENSDFRTWVLEEILELKEVLEAKQYFINNNTML